MMSKLKKQTNHHFSYTVSVDNSRGKIWHFLTDVSRWSEWDTELRDSRIIGDFALGTKGELIPRKGPKLKFHISALVPYHSYTFITKMPVGALEIKRTLQKDAGAIYFTDNIRFTGPFKRILGIMLGRGFKTLLPEVMENFKKLAERE